MERENVFLSDNDLAFIQIRLLKEKESILAKKKDFDSFCLDKNELSDPLDEASINVQTSHELRFRNREIFFLKKSTWFLCCGGIVLAKIVVFFFGIDGIRIFDTHSH